MAGGCLNASLIFRVHCCSRYVRGLQCVKV